MTVNIVQRSVTVVILVVFMAAGPTVIAEAQPSAGGNRAVAGNARVAAIIQSLRESGARLKQYEWVETTVVAVKGEQKMRKQVRCYHGEDGALQKVPVTAAPAPQKKRGLRGRVAAKKQAEMGKYMQRVIGMVHLYVPPDAKRLQSVKENGDVSIHILDPGKRIRLDFHNYRQPQDTLGVEVDLNTNRLLGLRVSSYIGTPQDSFTCNARFAGLKDGTSYLAQSVLDAKAKSLKVTVKNSGYRKAASMAAGPPRVAKAQPGGGGDRAVATHERAAAIIQSLRENRTRLQQYEWVETTVVVVEGEQKMRKQTRCYYGEDGALQKVPVTATPAPQKKRGLRGRVAAKKQAEMGEYMQRVIGMVHLYVPPDAKRLHSVKEKGDVSIHILDPGKRIRLDFHNVRQPQDTLGVEVDLNTNRLLGLKVSSYVGTLQDRFTCDARFAGLKDGATYPAETVLDAKAEDLKVTVKNSGYRKMASARNN